MPGTPFTENVAVVPAALTATTGVSVLVPLGRLTMPIVPSGMKFVPVTVTAVELGSGGPWVGDRLVAVGASGTSGATHVALARVIVPTLVGRPPTMTSTSRTIAVATVGVVAWTSLIVAETNGIAGAAGKVTVAPTSVTVTAWPRTVTLAAVATDVAAPANGHVTCAERTPVCSTGGTVAIWRSTDALAIVLVAEVDTGPRVAVLVIAPIVTPAATPIPFWDCSPLTAGAAAIGPTRLMPPNTGEAAARVMSTAWAVAPPPVDAWATGVVNTTPVSATNNVTTRIRIPCRPDDVRTTTAPTSPDSLCRPESSRFRTGRAAPRPGVSRPWSRRRSA